MKALSVFLSLLLMLGLCSCQQRSAPTAAMDQPTSQQELDLSSLTESSVGQALLGCVKEVNSVTITDQSTGEVVYQSADDVLSQSMYDALQIVQESLEAMDTVVADYAVDFSTKLGFAKQYQLWMSLNNDALVTVGAESAYWTLPQTESDWLRSRLKGLA